MSKFKFKCLLFSLSAWIVCAFLLTVFSLVFGHIVAEEGGTIIGKICLGQFLLLWVYGLLRFVMALPEFFYKFAKYGEPQEPWPES